VDTLAGATFPRAARLLESAAFTRALKSRPWRGRYLWVYRRPMVPMNGEAPHARLGMMVGKRQARTAVLRNAIKRRLREQFRLRRHALPAVDYMVRLTAVVSLAELDGIVAEWLGALEHDLRKSGAIAIPQATTVTSGAVA